MSQERPLCQERPLSHERPIKTPDFMARWNCLLAGGHCSSVCLFWSPLHAHQSKLLLLLQAQSSNPSQGHRAVAKVLAPSDVPVAARGSQSPLHPSGSYTLAFLWNIFSKKRRELILQVSTRSKFLLMSYKPRNWWFIIERQTDI